MTNFTLNEYDNDDDDDDDDIIFYLFGSDLFRDHYDEVGRKLAIDSRFSYRIIFFPLCSSVVRCLSGHVGR